MVLLLQTRLAFFLALCVLFLSSSTAADDSDVMSKLAEGLKNTPEDWSTGKTYCDWKGIECVENRVASVNLSSMSLSGSLPPNLNSLTQLTTLSLQNNSLSGPFPSLANLSFLQEIYLDTNNFTSIPSGCFQGLLSLQVLNMSQNINLDPWVFPTQLIQASSLVNLTAVNANLYGSLPDMFDNFPNLQILRLSYNNFSGALPKSFSGSGIQSLWLNNQQFGLSGTIEVLSNMTQLNQVWLHKNQFTGPIPDISKSETLFDLQLRDNLLTGIVPTTLMSSTAIQNVSLDNNKLQGPLHVFGSIVTKATFDGTNSFCQTKPGPCDPQVNTLLEVAGALAYPILLAESWEGNNAFHGWSFIVCDTQGKVITVNFENKHFTGIISPAFANLTSLKNLVLKNNNLTGSIPANLLTLTQLQLLDVSNNNLSGEIPKFSYTVKLITTSNVLIGTTPSSGGGGGGTPSGSGSNGTTPNGSPSPAPASGDSSVSPAMIAGIVIAVVIFIVVILFVSIKCYASKKHGKLGRVDSPMNGIEIAKSDVMSSANGYNGVQSDLHSQSSGDLHVFEGGNVAISIHVLRDVTNNFSEDNILGRGGFGVVYKATGRVTTRVDVYAFGVVLMQLLSGKKALDHTIPDERSLLVTWFRRFLIKKEYIPKAIDETLKNHDEETMECICKVAELAGHCTAHNPFQRPEMSYVVNSLAPLVRNWKPTSHEEEEKYGIDRHMSLPQGLEWQANEDASDVEVSWLTSLPRSLS
ncbi:hypothetical protein GBA52_004010 [Prunus armeniaca]|nr:hypothetical protein GBA52_004010 [Prunus armeniaca]